MTAPEPTRVLAVIPARLGSTRLPGKPLLCETGKPLIQHVYEAVRQVRTIDAVVVATDAREIVAAVEAFGGEAVLTRADHRTGTDRIAEVAAGRPEAAVVLNVQGDEPEIAATALEALVALATAPDPPPMATLATPFAPNEDPASPHAVKVVCDSAGNAVYFSRAAIPYDRDARAPGAGRFLRHLGVYAYRREFLLAFAAWPPAELEVRESLEQLRALAHGVRVRVGIVPAGGVGIDTPADYAAFVAREAARARNT